MEVCKAQYQEICLKQRIPKAPPTVALNSKISKTTPAPLVKRSSSAIEEKKESKQSTSVIDLSLNITSSLQAKKHNAESVKHKISDAHTAKFRHPKSSKNSSSLNKDTLRDDDIIPRGLCFLERQGYQEYYSRFGISQILRLPLEKCKEYFTSHDFQIFKCKKVKAIQGKQQKDQDEAFMNSLFAEPFDIYLVITEKAVFTTIDVSKEANKNKWMYVDSRYTMYDLVKITSRKNSGCIITFYFRIPTFKEYNLALEERFLEKLNEKPSDNYIFAHKRKKFIEICVVIKFESSEVAHECIEKSPTTLQSS